MSLSKRSLSMLPAIQRVRTAPRKLTSTIRALEPWKYPKSLHQGKNEKNGIAEAIPFLSCLTMFSYREAPFSTFFFLRSLLPIPYHSYLLVNRIHNCRISTCFHFITRFYIINRKSFFIIVLNAYLLPTPSPFFIKL